MNDESSFSEARRVWRDTPAMFRAGAVVLMTIAVGLGVWGLAKSGVFENVYVAVGVALFVGAVIVAPIGGKK